MTESGDLLRGIAPSIEREVQSRLTGFLGSFVRAYLPQVWVFDLGSESVHLEVDPQGRVAVREGGAPRPDVVVTLSAQRLRELLTSPRSPPATPPAGVQVTPMTAKGRAVFAQVRGRFGL